MIKSEFEDSDETELANELKMTVRKFVGPFATPDIIILAPGLPKTRSGKIMRRILRKIAARESSPEQLGGIFIDLVLSFASSGFESRRPPPFFIYLFI